MTTTLIAGIDFGSQLAGTTVVCREVEGRLTLFRSAKGKSADEFLEDHFTSLPPHLIGLDAPLSLPGVYRGLPGYDDYQYRKGDRLLRAMSPMFLGGLTARAMKLAAALARTGHRVIEVYPAALLKELQIVSGYKKVPAQCASVITAIQRTVSSKAPEEIQTSHDVDSFLAFLSAKRADGREAVIYGDEVEGVITV